MCDGGGLCGRTTDFIVACCGCRMRSRRAAAPWVLQWHRVRRFGMRCSMRIRAAGFPFYRCGSSNRAFAKPRKRFCQHYGTAQNGHGTPTNNPPHNTVPAALQFRQSLHNPFYRITLPLTGPPPHPAHRKKTSPPILSFSAFPPVHPAHRKKPRRDIAITASMSIASRTPQKTTPQNYIIPYNSARAVRTPLTAVPPAQSPLLFLFTFTCRKHLPPVESPLALFFNLYLL